MPKRSTENKRKASTKEAKADLPETPPVRTPEQEALVKQHKARSSALPRFKGMDDAPNQVQPASGGDFDLWTAKLCELMGVSDPYLAGSLLQQLTNCNTTMARTAPDQVVASANVTLSAIREIAPRDGVESMLATQMVATHSAAMEALRRLSMQQPSIDVYDSLCNRANKFMRTYTAQVEALNRYRNAGKQTITVNHIGQQVNATEAIAFGCIPGEAGGVIKNGEPPHVSQRNQQLNYQPEDDMRSHGETQRETVPPAANGKRQMLPPRRSEPRRPARPRELELQARPIHNGSDS